MLLVKVEDFFRNIDYFIWIFTFRNFFLKIVFLKSINPSIILYTKHSFLAWLALLKFFAKKKNGFWYLKYFENISSFISFLLTIISFMNSCRNFNLEFLWLVSFFASSGVGSRVEILSKFFIGNSMFLKLLRTFSPAGNNNPKVIIKRLFQLFFYLYLNSLT